MVQDMDPFLKVEYGNMLSMAVAALATQHDKLDERIGAIETANTFTDTPLRSMSGQPAPIRHPPGYSSSSQTQAPATSLSHGAPRSTMKGVIKKIVTTISATETEEVVGRLRPTTATHRAIIAITCRSCWRNLPTSTLNAIANTLRR